MPAPLAAFRFSGHRPRVYWTSTPSDLPVEIIGVEEIPLAAMSQAAAERNAAPASPDPAGGGADVSESIMNVIRPSIEKLDDQVKRTRKGQIALAEDIDRLSEYLKGISDNQQMPFDLDKFVRKLEDSQRRITSVATRLQSIHDRMGQLQRNITRETFRQKQQQQPRDAAEEPSS